ncbi:MAG: hydroxymethylpyrimidine/phosphomethylpyrimidine kinase [Alteromonadaceae bacterium]|nr:MAG: hydroxymethylpyrimidine/phosphomethylpyrimidine kinase [Alteromonadaceae bacterium]
MNESSANPPIVLTFSALDPTGCGGIQADIETASSLGCHCTPIVSALCADASRPEAALYPTDATIIIEQARSILKGMAVKAIKIGFLGSAANTEAVHSILRDYQDLPVISHPTLCLWDGQSDDSADFAEAYSTLILPMSNVAIFSVYEAIEVSQESDTVSTAASAIVSSGCERTLITGTGKHTKAFQNSLYGEKGLIQHYPWEQEPPSDHGSNSTLTTSIAAYMAHGFDAQQAVEHGLNYTWQAMRASRDLGFKKRTPHRFYWADKNIPPPGELPVEKHSH